MTNEHMELVKKWLADKDSVSLEELEENAKGAESVMNASRVDKRVADIAEGDAAWADADAAFYAAVARAADAEYRADRVADRVARYAAEAYADARYAAEAAADDRANAERAADYAWRAYAEASAHDAALAKKWATQYASAKKIREKKW